MPYKKSKSRIEFEKKTDELLNLAKAISYKKVTLSYDHKNLIYQSSIVLLCSSLEEYIRVFIEDLFYNYRLKSALLSKIPINSRTFSLFHKQRTIYEAFVYSRDERTILEKLKVDNPHLYSLIDETKVLTNHIDSRLIVNDKKYPSPKNLKILYNRIGIKNIFPVINGIGRKDYEFLLRSFLDIRETIAHQQPINLTYEDLKRNFINILDLLDKLDRASFSHICRESGMQYWV
ncbi:MAG: hypothetical protein JO080_02585 [Mucilaginibacter sp.]|nr:hypothetical protein [Mucilaginibacter sp.]